MKTVLIVDDEQDLRSSFEEGLSVFSETFKVVTAENGARASAILGSIPIDLVVTDIRMPVMDGIELLSRMSKHYPSIPAIVMTAHAGAPDFERRLKDLPVSHCIRKPVSPAELAPVIINELKFTSAGHIQGITLPTFLQLIAGEERTCTLTVTCGSESGYFYFARGVLIDSEIGRLRGNEAVYHMVLWEHIEIDVSPFCSRKDHVISGSLDTLLMEAIRRKDEAGVREAPADGAFAPAPETVAAAVPQDWSPQQAAAGAEPAPGAVTKPEPVPVAVAEPEPVQGDAAVLPAVPTMKEEKMATTKEILGELSKVPSVEAICLVARDGFLVDSIARSGIDKEMIGAIASSGFGASASMGRQLDKGAMQISMIEFEKGPVLFTPVGDDAFLVIVADKDANLGMIRLKLKKHSHELALAAAL